MYRNVIGGLAVALLCTSFAPLDAQQRMQRRGQRIDRIENRVDRQRVRAARRGYPGYLAVRADLYARGWARVAAHVEARAE